LRPGYFADVVVFDPGTVQDHATYEAPQQFATGVRDVLVNGRFALKDGEPTGAAAGRFVRGRAAQGGCRAESAAWSWAK
jgi:N-acyl-D-amino-acid deacylase